MAEERIGNIRTVRAFAQESRETNAYGDKITDILKLTYKEAGATALLWASVSDRPRITIYNFVYIIYYAIINYIRYLNRVVFIINFQNGLIGNMAILGVFYYGGHLMNDDLITVGQLTSFLFYALFVGSSLSSKKLNTPIFYR